MLRNEIKIPPKVLLVISLRHILRHEKYWGSNANSFDPHRFDADKLKDFHFSSYILFGCGSRNCVGKINKENVTSHFFNLYLLKDIHYAKMAVKCTIAHMVRNYRIETTYKSIDDLIIIPSISYRFTKGHIIRLIERKY